MGYLLSELERIAERRKELNDMIKVMKNAQKIIRRDDLMTVIQININDSDITSHAADNKKKEEKKVEKKVEKKEPEKQSPAVKKKNLGNLFG